MKLRTNLLTTAAITLALTIPALAGSIWLEFGNPTANTDPNAKDALTVVRATGCHEPEKAVYTAVAEGKVDGKRKSIPLQVVKLSAPTYYAIKGVVPKEGTWVISVSSTVEGSFLASAILPVSAKGVERMSASVMHHPITDQDVEKALQR